MLCLMQEREKENSEKWNTRSTVGVMGGQSMKKEEECECWGLRYEWQRNWHSVEFFWEHPLVLGGIHGVGVTILLGDMTDEGAEVFRNNPSQLCFLLHAKGMDSIARVSMRRWSELAGPQRKRTCSQSLHKRVWKIWQCDSDLKCLGYMCTRVYILPQKDYELGYPWGRGCVHAHQLMKEIPACASHSLRSKWRLALKGSSHTPPLFHPPQITRYAISWCLAGCKGEKME